MRRVQNRREVRAPRSLDRAVAVLAATVAVVGAAAWFDPDVAGQDLWLHLATGRDVLRLGTVPVTDIYSYTFAGARWLNHEWLWGVGHWVLYDLDPQAVAWFDLGVLAAVYALTYAYARAASDSRLGAGAAVWLAAASAHWFLDIRPHLFTLLFVALFLATRRRRWAPWLWPVLVVPWANIHGGVIFGVAAIGLYVLLETLQTRPRAGRWTAARASWASVALCLLALGVTPFGFALLDYFPSLLDAGSSYRSLLEWRPTELRLDPHLFQGRFWLGAAFAALGVPLLRRRDPYVIVLAAVTCVMAAVSRRFIPLFGVCGAPLVAVVVGRVASELARRVPLLRAPGAPFATVAVAAVVAAFLWRDVRFHPNLLERWTRADLFPEAAVRYLVALGAPPRLLVYYPWASYVMLRAPQMKVFIDGRASTVYDEEIYDAYMQIELGAPALHQHVARWGADAALFMSSTATVTTLTKPPSSWKLVYADELASILLPPDSPYLARRPDLEAALGGHFEYAMIQGERARRAGNLDEAILQFRRAAARDPIAECAWNSLADVYGQRRDLAAVAAVIDEGIRANPRRRKMLRYHESLVYERLGELSRALAAARAGVPGGPFIPAEPFAAHAARIERRLTGR